MSQSIKLYNARGNHKTFHSSDQDLKKTDVYVKAVVASGKWILYKEADDNKSLGNGARAFENVVLTAGSEPVDISIVNGSLLHVPSAEAALMLFEFLYYGGSNKEYKEENADLGEDFPKGAMSAMVGKDKNWQVFPKAGEHGTPQELIKATDYATTGDMNVPTVNSIKPL